MKKLLALMLALTMVFALAACGAKDGGETTTTTEEITSEETTEATETEVDSTAEEAETDAAATEADTTVAEAETEAEAAAKAPETTEEILKVYNDAVSGAVDAKAGYSKSRTTTINNLNGGALLKIQLVVDTVNDFLGAGTKTYSNAKGKTDFMGKASLTAADVTSAKCTEKDGKYTIELAVKNGSSSANNSGTKDGSAINRTGLFVGEGDNSAFDYKSAANVHYALNHTDGASVESVTLNTSNVKVTAVIDAASGKLESLKIGFNFDVSLINVKYSIAKVSAADGDATTSVTFKDFKY